MSYSIEITPDRLVVTADLGLYEIAALIDALTVVTPLIGAGANRPEEITREPKQAKALRAAKAEKQIKPEPQETAVPVVVTKPERIVPPPRPGRGHPVLTDRDDKLRELWPTNLSLQQIGYKIGLHFTTVSQRAKYLGLPSRLQMKGKRKPPADDGKFDPAYYARNAIIPDAATPASGAEITAALMGDPSHGPSVGAERAGQQRDGGGA